jgi:hypothetical protein
MSREPFGIVQLTARFRNEGIQDQLRRHYWYTLVRPRPNLKRYPFYADLQLFRTIEYNVPPGLEKAFDWPLLIRMVGAAPGVSCWFEFSDRGELPDLFVSRRVRFDYTILNIRTLEHSEVSNLFYDLFRKLLKAHTPHWQNPDFHLHNRISPEETARMHNNTCDLTELEIFRRRETNKLRRFLETGG